MSLLIWTMLLLLLGLGLILLEVFIPSGGVLGALAALAVVAAIVLAFFQGPYVGLGVAVLTVVALPAVIALGLRLWPSTSIGRRILLTVPSADELLPDDATKQRYRGLVGKRGVAQSLMLPSGAVLIDGHVFDATSPGLAIEAGTAVRVVEVHGTRIVVRPIDEEDDAELPEPAAETTSSDPLSRSVESLGLEGFDQPLG
ncbi:MAG: NfeD family protein [Pirellulales bacterium]